MGHLPRYAARERWRASLSLVATNVQKSEDHARRRPKSGGGQRHVAGLILVSILVIAPLGGFSGRFGGCGYGYGHGGGGVLGVTLDRSP